MPLEWTNYTYRNDPQGKAGASVLNGPELALCRRNGGSVLLLQKGDGWTATDFGSWPTLEQAQSAIVHAMLKRAMEQVEALKKLAAIEPLIRHEWDEIHMAQKLEDLIPHRAVASMGALRVLCADGCRCGAEAQREIILQLMRRLLAEHPVVVNVGAPHDGTKFKCSDCDGTGMAGLCHRCGGTGLVDAESLGSPMASLRVAKSE